jgi:hypothetical protein
VLLQLFADNQDHYSICVHGCNHLGNEFGGGSYQELCTLASVALWRMAQHRKITGLPCDPVIVFPQGRFSSVAMKALKDSGYFAAFNSTIKATDGEEPPADEFQHPASLMYHGFPLFMRRYPKDKSRFLDDLVSGRPILLVQHHGDFINGYKELTDLVDWINTLGNIKWASLLKISEHYLGKKAPNPIDNGQNILPAHSKLSPKTMIRRFLSEARDNYVETNAVLTKLYRAVRG